ALAGTAAHCRPGAPARHPAQQRPSGHRAGQGAAGGSHGSAVRGLPGPSSGRLAGSTLAGAAAAPALYRRRQPAGNRFVRPLRRDYRPAAGGAAMSAPGLEWSILAPALAAGALVLSTHVPLGRQVLQRGIIFIDLAIAQIAALGVMVAAVFGWEESTFAVQLAAAAAAGGGALLMTWSARRWPQIQE